MNRFKDSRAWRMVHAATGRHHEMTTSSARNSPLSSPSPCPSVPEDQREWWDKTCEAAPAKRAKILQKTEQRKRKLSDTLRDDGLLGAPKRNFVKPNKDFRANPRHACSEVRASPSRSPSGSWTVKEIIGKKQVRRELFGNQSAGKGQGLIIGIGVSAVDQPTISSDPENISTDGVQQNCQPNDILHNIGIQSSDSEDTEVNLTTEENELGALSTEQVDQNNFEENNLIDDVARAGIPLNEELIVIPLDIPVDSDSVVPTHDAIVEGNNPDEGTEETQSRRRKRDPSRWKKNVRKQKKAAGQPYCSSRGQNIPAKTLKKGCSERCKLKCQSKLSQSDRLKIFKEFYKIEDHTRKWDFITREIEKIPVKRRTTPEDDERFMRRKKTLVYRFTVDNQKIRICQKMFLDTLAISPQYVRTAFKKLGKGGAISPDKRGGKKPNKKRKITPSMLESVLSHIKKYPLVESHYVRKKNKRQYLPEGLNVRLMHRMFQTENPDSKITYRQYQDIFVSNFNYGFFRPKKDQCSTCRKYYNKSPAERTAGKAMQDKHIRNKERSRELKEIDSVEGKSKSNFCATTFDLEKVLECPRSCKNAFFYFRKLSVYNLTCYDALTHEGFCFVWDQTVAKKGANEVSSCVLKYIEMKAELGVKEFSQYSDNCSSQNKNFIIFTMYYMACVKYQLKITQRYLEVGHTQMECDGVHAMIEKKMRKAEVFTPSEYYALISCAKVNPPSYKVIQMDQNNIFDISSLGKLLDWSKVPTSKVKEIVFDHEAPGCVTFKIDFDEEGKTVPIIANRVGRPINWKTVKLDRAFFGKIPVPKNKIQDFKKFKPDIPPSAQWYWNTLIEESGKESQDVRSEEEREGDSNEEDSDEAGSDEESDNEEESEGSSSEDLDEEASEESESGDISDD